MADRQYLYLINTNGPVPLYSRWYNETYIYQVRKVELKKDRYRLIVATSDNQGTSELLIDKNDAKASDQLLETLALVAGLSSQYQQSVGLTISASAEIWEREVNTYTHEWRYDHATWNSYGISDDEYARIRAWYDTWKISTVTTYPVLYAIGGDYDGSVIMACNLDKVNYSFTIGKDDVSTRLKNVAKLMVDGCSDTNYYKKYEYPFIRTETINRVGKKETISVSWDISIDTEKQIREDITRRKNAINSLDRTGRIDALSKMYDGTINSLGFTTTNAPRFYMDNHPLMESEVGSWVVGEVVEVYDGDTITIHATNAFNVYYSVEGSGSMPLIMDRNYQVRFVGVNCPETKKGDDAQQYEDQQRNIDWLSDHNLPNDKDGTNLQMAYDIAQDAKVFTTELLLGKTVIIDVETADNGYGKGIDPYNRILGVVHLPLNFNMATDSINVNRTLLQTRSKSHSEFSFADIDYMLKNVILTSKFPVLGWGIKDADWIHSTPEEQDEGLAELFESFKSGNTLIDIKGNVWYNNKGNTTPLTTEQIKQLEASDLYNGDRVYQSSLGYHSNINPLIDDNDTTEFAPYDDMKTPYHVRIGDVTLIVPPLSIHVMNTSRNEKVNTLRNRNAIQIQSGYSDCMITMELFFHDVESINGIEIQNPFQGNRAADQDQETFETLQKLWPEPYYINGLRALLAQFIKAPFVPIYNEFLETTYEIQSVALESVEVATVPGFPNMLAVTLTMIKFDHSAYMPDVYDLGEMISWPVFRWYIQDALQPRYVTKEVLDDLGRANIETVLDPHHIYIQKIAKQFNDDISFEIANEPMLEARLKAIQRLRNLYAPYIFKGKNDGADTTIGQFQRDYEAMSLAIQQRDNFMRWKETHPPEKYPAFYYQGTNIFSTLASGENLLNHIEINFPTEEQQDVFELLATVYGEDWNEKRSNGMLRMCFLLNGMEDTTSISSDWPIVPDQQLPINKDGGWLVVPVYAEVNRNFVKNDNVWNVDIDNYTLCAIEPLDVALANRVMINGKEGGVDSYQAYEDQITALGRIADVSEDSIPMDPVKIDGLHVISISSSANNVLTKLQVQESESPTLQYLGGQEMYFTIKAQTKSRETVSALRQLVQKSQRLAREYRIAINSGFLNINNDLINFLGVRSILVEQMAVQTVHGTPELINIELNCTAFDKTQRERESIKQIQLKNPESGEYTLEKFQEYFKQHSNNEAQQWVIFDYKLRQQELYPDLDLPTWVEFEAAIPYLNCGFRSLKELDERITKITGNLPPDRAKYVDPDFYIHTEWTNRLLVYQALMDKDASALLLKDLNDVKSAEIVPSSPDEKLTKPNVQVNDRFWVEDEAMRQQIAQDLGGSSDELEDKDLAEQINQAFVSVDTGYYTRHDSNAVPEQIYDNDRPSVNMDAVNVYRYSASSAKDRDKFIFEYMHVVPTVDELMRWRYGTLSNNRGNAIIFEGLRSRLSEQLKDPFEVFKNPTYAEVVRAIERCVDKYFIFPNANDRTDSGQDSIYGKNGIISLPRITRRKVISVLKSVVHYESGFKQFYKGKQTIGGVEYDQPMPTFPIKYGDLNKTQDGWIAVGLMQMAVGTAGYAKNLDEARRMAWDWEYNLDVGIANFANHYRSCMENSNAEISVLPLDYAIVKYHRPADNTLSVDYYRKVKSIFDNNYAGSYQTYADPETTRNASLAYEANTKLIETKSISSAFIDNYLTGSPKNTFSQYSNFVKFWKENKGPANNNGISFLKFKAITLNGLPGSDFVDYNEKLTLAIAKSIDEYIALYGSYDPDVNIVVIDTEIKKETKTRSQGWVKTEWSNQEYTVESNEFKCRIVTSEDELNDIINIKQAQSKFFLPNSLTAPSEALYNSFHDSIEFDMRGRLVRAFPTFQMFIIDEGRWSFWYKLWDNLYGYNAIQSIDLIRDRESVADTLIMQMTNVYSNLSTKYSRYEDYDSSFTILDLFSGSADDKAEVWKTMWNIADDDIIQARSEQLDTMMLKPGARIHLRLGYGSNADNMPVVFNGCITEMDSQEIITVIAQSDGIELTSKLNAKPNEMNASFFNWRISEPRELICGLMSSKGSFWKDKFNQISGGAFFQGNPLGIVHFGGDSLVPPALSKIPFFRSSDDDYGEVAFNIYSANGFETFSSWICYGKMDKYKENSGTITWGREASQGETVDEPNILVYLYDKTVWDIVNLLSMAVPDYICAVHPFELRSTLFYGKPMWGLSYQYDYLFRIDPDTKGLQRIITNEFRKPYSQFHLFNGFSDIVANRVKATEAGMYTNVIVSYGGNDEKTTPIIHADTDIDMDKQRTAIVSADIALNKIGIGTGIFSRNYWTSEYYAQSVGANALRNYMNHMYDGELIVLGYPSIKPHDKFYLEDNYNDIQGIAGVRRVVHHMSFDTGFITCITPDCIAVVDDMQQLSWTNWQSAIAGTVATRLITKKIAVASLNKLFGGIVGRSWRRKPEQVGKAIGGFIGKIVKSADDPATIKFTDDIMDALRSGRKLTGIKGSIMSSNVDSRVVRGLQTFFTKIDDAVDMGKAWKQVGNAAKLMRTLKGAAVVADVALGVAGAVILEVGTAILINGLVEMYRRYRNNRQAIVIMPLKYRGKPYTAGINGHKGLIYGETPGKWDKWFEESWMVQLFDGLIFDEDKNPSLRRKATSVEQFITDR